MFDNTLHLLKQEFCILQAVERQEADEVHREVVVALEEPEVLKAERQL